MSSPRFPLIGFSIFVLLCASGAAGCSDDGQPLYDEQRMGSEMADEGVVTVALSDVDDDFVQGANPMAAVNASLKLVMSSTEVIDLLELDITPETIFLDPSQKCFDITTPGGLSVEFDFTGCQQYGLAGKIRVTKKISGLFAGPILITFKDEFAIRDVAISGTLGLKRIAGKRLTFNFFTADLGETQGTPLTVEYLSKGITATVRYDGKIKLSLMSQELLFWGIASSTIEGVTSTIYVGGVSEEEVVGNQPSADAIVYQLLPFDCYCPSRGVMSGNLTLNIGEISFDLDDFTPDNGIDDYPAFVIPVNVDGSYSATISFRECGQMKVQLNVENDTPIDLSVGIDKILSALDSANDQGLIPDDIYNQMSAIIAKYQGSAPSFKITVGDLVNSVSGLLDEYVYVPFCVVS